MLGIDMQVGELGLTPLIAHVFALALLIIFLRDGNTAYSRPHEGLRRLILGKIFFGVMLSMLSSSTPGGGLFSFTAPVVDALRLFGSGYFLTSMLLDLLLLAVYTRLEFHRAALASAANIVYIPFYPLIPLFIAFREQQASIRRIAYDVSSTRDEHAAVLGSVSKSVRIVEQPYRRGEDAQTKTHILIRRIPAWIPVLYSPLVGEREFNPHMIIAGTSGAGKTTTTYSLITQLMKRYQVVVFDVKGDFTEAFYSEGLIGKGVVAYMVSRSGIDPFKPVVDNEEEHQMVEDLMDSISVLEEVGAKQAHFIREAYYTLAHNRQELTYENLVKQIELLHEQILEGRIRYGPQTRDALQGIHAKLKDLREIFKSSGIGLRDVFSGLVEKAETPVTVLNLSGIGEKSRAIALELMLRKFAKMMERRGPLAFKRGNPVVAVIDEAYLVTKPVLLKGGREAGSRSKLEDIVRTGRSYGVAIVLVTQKLSDISDGIRQNCYRWIVFNTSSPEDMWILRQVAPTSIQRIMNDLEKGEAYIKLVIPGRQESYGSQDPERIITEGYIFNMERKLLETEEKQGGHIEIPSCPNCGMVTSGQHTCRRAPVERREPQPQAPRESVELAVKIGGSEDVKREDRENTDTNKGIGEWKTKNIITSARLARQLAIRRAKDIEIAETLKNIPDDVVARFLENWHDMDYGKFFVKHGLLKFEEGKLKRTLAGNLLLKVFREVASDA